MTAPPVSSPTAETYLFDIETDGLLDTVSVLHVACVVRLEDKQRWVFDKALYDDPLREFQKFLIEAASRGAHAGGHNVIGYDIPALAKLGVGWPFEHARTFDTIVLARLLWPDLKGSDLDLWKRGTLPGQLIKSHSLEAWGHRLGVLKGDYGKKEAAWDTWTPEMTSYCQQDVLVTCALYDHVMKHEPDPRSVKLEHDVAWIISRQERHGVVFDVAAAQTLYGTIRELEQAEAERLRGTFPLRCLPKGKETSPKKNNMPRGVSVGCPYQNVVFREYNPRSQADTIYWFMKRYGWVPEEKTDKGRPKLDDDVLRTLDFPEAKQLAFHAMLAKRLGQLGDGDGAWLKKYDAATGRMYGRVVTNGCVTGRMSHFSPNMAQVPKVKKNKQGEVLKGPEGLFGFECRSLFAAPQGRLLVGCDASGLELRCLAHYLAKYDGGRYGKELIEGDIHTHNMKAAGLSSRDQAKTFIYGYLAH